MPLFSWGQNKIQQKDKKLLLFKIKYYIAGINQNIH